MDSKRSASLATSLATSRATGVAVGVAIGVAGPLAAHVVKRRRNFTVDIRLELAAGDALGLFGNSGAGKSTVLACLAGYEQPDAGSVRVGEAVWFRSADEAGGATSVPPHRRDVGLLTQEAGLFPHLSVAENVLFGLDGTRRRDAETRHWVETLRDRLGLQPLWEAMPRAISGGQVRRVALARMLARRPRLVLLDEPFTGLDRPLVRELVRALAEWRAELGFSLIAVDHQPEVLRGLCPERVMAVEAGHVAQEGAWEMLHREPATELLRSQLAPL